MTGDRAERLERQLGRVLGLGVRASAVALGVGLVLFVVGASPAVAGGLMTTGLIVLMATPMLRVLLSVVEYYLVRDWFFFGTTLAVLLVLAATVGLALAH